VAPNRKGGEGRKGRRSVEGGGGGFPRRAIERKHGRERNGEISGSAGASERTVGSGGRSNANGSCGGGAMLSCVFLA